MCGLIATLILTVAGLVVVFVMIVAAWEREQ